MVVVGILFVLSRGDDDDGDEVSTATSTSSSTVPRAPFTFGTGPCPAPDGSSPQTLTFPDAPQQCIDPANGYLAAFDTTAGPVRVQLDTAVTPGTANNFAALARYHYYDGTNLFRTNTGIGILQGGSPNTQDNSDPGPGYNLPDEGFDYNAIDGQGGPYAPYQAGDLVMARGAQANGASAQFFFCVTAACSGLDSQGVYVRFGRVVEGLEVLEAILGSHQATNPASPDEGAPDPVPVVNSITIEEAPPAPAG